MHTMFCCGGCRDLVKNAVCLRAFLFCMYMLGVGEGWNMVDGCLYLTVNMIFLAVYGFDLTKKPLV